MTKTIFALAVPAVTRPRLLDLFSGSGSVANLFREKGYEVVTLDIDPKYQADIHIDILVWEYWTAYPPGHFNVIACSPPCTEFSQAMTRRRRELDYADALVKRGVRS